MSEFVLAPANLSTGNPSLIGRVAEARPVVLDSHSDIDHGRTVVTCAGKSALLTPAVFALASAATTRLFLEPRGAHPRYGVLDVLPFVPYRAPEEEAVALAQDMMRRIPAELGVPCYPYDRAAPGAPSLPELRRWLARERPPSHPTAGVVCVGVRDPLIAFNVNLRGSLSSARRVAVQMRRMPAVRSLAFFLRSRDMVQVSMNLIDPATTGPRAAFDRVAELSGEQDLAVVEAEVVGLVPEPFLPQFEGMPLAAPVRSIEQAIADKGL